MRKKILISVAAATAMLVGAGVTTSAIADSNDTQSVPEPVLDSEALDEALDKIVELGGTSAVAEVHDGNEFWSNAAGPRELGGDEATKRGDQVRIGSLTKSMVTTVLLQLTQESDLDIDAPVEEYLPGLLPYEQEITVRQLLGHTSGIPDYFPSILPSLTEGSADDLPEGLAVEYGHTELIDIATQNPLLFEPGEKWSYSNTNYYVLGLLVEELTGESVDTNLNERIFEPLHLDDTYLPGNDEMVIEGDHPVPYMLSDDPDEGLIDTDQWHTSVGWAAGSVVSTTDDTNAFFRAMFDGSLLPQELLDEARTLSPQSGEAYGLGIQAIPAKCDSVPGGVAYGHTGGTLGHSTWSFHSPDGERQMTLTYSLDDQLNPSEDFHTAVNDFAVTALCGAPSGATTQDETPQVTLPDSVVRG